jgi:hypothetical protein
MWRRVGLLKTDLSEGHIVSISRMERVGELETTLSATSWLLDLVDWFHPDDRGDTILRNGDSYKSHTA